MTGLGLAGVAVALGIRHAADADHLVAIGALLQRDPGPWRAARVAALWALGHSASFLAVGVPVVLSGLQLPRSLELGAELLVAAMLITLGVGHLQRSRRGDASAAPPRASRPVVIGVIHGLAGSAGIALIAATTIDSAAWAVVYLTVFAIGTVLGMVAATVILSWPLAWTITVS